MHFNVIQETPTHCLQTKIEHFSGYAKITYHFVCTFYKDVKILSVWSYHPFKVNIPDIESVCIKMCQGYLHCLLNNGAKEAYSLHFIYVGMNGRMIQT